MLELPLTVAFADADCPNAWVQDVEWLPEVGRLARMAFASSPDVDDIVELAQLPYLFHDFSSILLRNCSSDQPAQREQRMAQSRWMLLQHWRWMGDRDLELTCAMSWALRHQASLEENSVKPCWDVSPIVDQCRALRDFRSAGSRSARQFARGIPVWWT